MRHFRPIFYCITLVLICQVAAVLVFPAYTASALSDTQQHAIQDHCDSIKEVLKNIQKDDSRTRVYLGAYYEAILSKFVTPLNVRLVENNLSSASLVENQNKLANARSVFINNFITYQQGLEELVLMDCQSEPKQFYEKLEKVRQQRKKVEQNTQQVRGLITDHIKLVNQLREGL